MQFFDRSQCTLKVENIFLEVEEKIIKILPNANIEYVGASAIPGAGSIDQCDQWGQSHLICLI